MTKFSPADIDALLDAKGQRPDSSDVPTAFFEKMEERILAAVATEPTVAIAAIAEAKAANTVAMPHHRSRRSWMYAAAAVIVLTLVSTLSIKYVYDYSQPSEHLDNIYAVTDDMTDDDIDNLDDLYESDVFLEQL